MIIASLFLLTTLNPFYDSGRQFSIEYDEKTGIQFPVNVNCRGFLNRMSCTANSTLALEFKENNASSVGKLRINPNAGFYYTFPQVKYNFVNSSYRCDNESFEMFDRLKQEQVRMQSDIQVRKIAEFLQLDFNKYIEHADGVNEYIIRLLELLFEKSCSKHQNSNVKSVMHSQVKRIFRISNVEAKIIGLNIIASYDKPKWGFNIENEMVNLSPDGLVLEDPSSVSIIIIACLLMAAMLAFLILLRLRPKSHGDSIA